MNKKGFTDMDVWMSPGVVFLTVLGWAGVVGGYVMGKRMEIGVLPIWQILIVLAVIPFAAYYFANRG